MIYFFTVGIGSDGVKSVANRTSGALAQTDGKWHQTRVIVTLHCQALAVEKHCLLHLRMLWMKL